MFRDVKQAVLKDASFEVLKTVLRDLKERYRLSPVELIELAEEPDMESIPLEIFAGRSLSGLEAIVKFLHEERALRYSEIALLLKRDQRTIWNTYRNSQTKMKAAFSVTASKSLIPIQIFANRTLSVLEALSSFLREEKGLSNIQTSKLLNRNARTIWTVYNRSVKKRRMKV